MNEAPVFVAGLERSGTSLMYALLATHPNISMTRRTNFWRYFVDRYGDLEDDRHLDACLAAVRAYKRLVVLELDHERLRADLVAGPRTYGHLYRLIQEQVAERRGKPRWGDKSLELERYTDPILAEFPHARILHMIRDPRDRLASVLARWQVRRGDVGAGTAAWLWSARLAARYAVMRPENVKIVRYEWLAEQPEQALREICDFIGEPFCSDMLTMAGGGRFRETGSNSSYGAREVGVISTDSIGRYREVLAPRQIAFIQTAAERELIELGYSIDNVPMRGGERLRFTAAYRPYNRAVMAAWSTRSVLSPLRGHGVPSYRMVGDSA